MKKIQDGTDGGSALLPQYKEKADPAPTPPVLSSGPSSQFELAPGLSSTSRLHRRLGEHCGPVPAGSREVPERRCRRSMSHPLRVGI